MKKDRVKMMLPQVEMVEKTLQAMSATIRNRQIGGPELLQSIDHCLVLLGEAVHNRNRVMGPAGIMDARRRAASGFKRHA